MTASKRSERKPKGRASGKGRARRPRRRRPETPREWALLCAKWGAIVSLAVTALGAATLAILFWIYGSDPKLPNIRTIDDYRPAQVKRVLSPDSRVVGEIYSQRRTLVSFEELPEVLVQAFVSAEDSKFWKHEGIDYMGMVRALFVNLKSGKKKQGASTITQQVVKNLLLTRERTFRRKFQEIILARRLEDKLTKEEILTLYANEIFFGHGRYGVQEASRYYFGKDVGSLNAGEAAVLAGLPKGPNLYSPKKNPEQAKIRQIYVLSRMAENGYLSTEEAQKWIDEPIAVVGEPYPHLGSAAEWVDIAREELEERFGDDADFLGADIITNVDLGMQEVAQSALREGLREYDERRGYGRRYRKVDKSKIELEVAKLAKRLPKGGPKEGGVYSAVVTAVEKDEIVVDLGKHQASILLGGAADRRFNPEGLSAAKRFAIGDVVRVTKGEGEGEPAHSERQVVFAPGPEGAVVIIHPHTRRLLAVVGGYDVGVGDFNRATMAKRQAGSTFKPIVYAAAISSGDFTAASIVNDAPEVYDLWKPENYKKGEFAGPVRLRHALAKSINTVAIKVAYDLTTQSVIDMARTLGIKADLPDGLSLALGSGEVTPMELTNAFATLAADGKYADVWAVRSVGDEELTAPEPSEVLDPRVAYVVRDMMRSVITEGTGGRAKVLNLDVVGKTGTSNSARDAWFMGMTPNLAVGVWVGFDDFQRPLGGKEGGSRTALPIFVDIMTELGDRNARFSRPEGVVEVRIDEATGLLAPETMTEGVRSEVFVEGTEPREFAPAPGEMDIDTAILDQYGGVGLDPAAEPETTPDPAGASATP